MSHTSRILSRFATVYGREISAELLLEYRLLLDPIPPELLDAAVDVILAESQWFPKPASILAAVRRIETESASGPVEPEHWRLDRHRCVLCSDTGYVAIYSAEAMKAALRATQGDTQALPYLDRYLRAHFVACCKCEVGESRAQGWARRRRQEEWSKFIFRSPPMIQVDRGHDLHGRKKMLLDWAEKQKPIDIVG